MAQVPQPTSAMQPVLRALRLPHLGAGSKIARAGAESRHRQSWTPLARLDRAA